MTRFARAKGSKASNEKTPEDSTPWEVMKEQLLNTKKDSDEAKKKELAEQQRIENYENFLKERKIQKRKVTWCDFPEAVSSKKSLDESPVMVNLPAKKSKKSKKLNTVTDNTEHNNSAEAFTNIPACNKPAKKKKNQVPVLDSAQDNVPTVDTTALENNITNTNVVKLKKKKKKKQVPDSGQDNLSTEGTTAQENNKNKKKNNNNTRNTNQVKVAKKKKKKLVDGKPVRRKDLNDKSFQLIINGKEVELERFDGFPIMKKDAERLQDLKMNMMKKGIPKSEVQRTIKLERRRAEKALARLKRDVCYNCRKGGHNLSDCPDLKSKIPGVDAAEGLCFKCGSTEHRQFECKVQRDKEFRFATCFICKEAGHIARQCPDNPKGLYPNGGCCKLCGDVTHLKKDCPTINTKKEETTMKLQTLDSGDNIEDVGQQVQAVSEDKIAKKPKKIKF